MPENVVETRNLTKVYRDFWGRKKKTALNALDLTIHKGEIFGLLGPNGSGKTTTIKLLLGLLFPSSGEGFVFGEPAAKVEKNERIGYLPEESYLYRFLNAEETLDFYGRLFDIPPEVRRKRTEELIDVVGLNADKKRILREYSKGMRQRIGLAQALINDPDLITLDEPTSGLDPLGTRWMGLSAPGVGIHGTDEPASIGYSESHGCIRMQVPVAEWLFQHVQVGTTVHIV